MTLQDIKNEVAALGFEADVPIDNAFIFSLRRALGTAYSERGVHKTLRLYQRTQKPDFLAEKTIHNAGEELTFSFKDGAYFFRASGCGSFTLIDKSGSRRTDFNSVRSTHKGFICGEGTISFTGDFCYTVYDMCHFKELFSDNKDNIFFGKFKEYALKDYAPDFLGVCDEIRDGNDKVIKDASVCTDTLLIPYEYEGEVTLTYRCAPPRITPDVTDLELDIDPELSHLIPLLAASYIWLDDDAEKAQYYMTLYRNGMASLKMYSTRCLDSRYENVTRWA